MLQYLRDPAWQFAGAVIALLAIAATFLIYFLQRQRKSLTYEVLSKSSLLTVREELENRLQVLYDGEPTRDICLLVIRIINSGTEAIASRDFEKPICIGTGPTSKILSAAITGVEPENLDVRIFAAESSATIDPLLLNPRDSIEIKLLVSDQSGTLSIEGRVLGVRSIENARRTRPADRALVFISIACAISGLLLIFRYEPHPAVEPLWPLEAKLGVFLTGAAYVAMLFSSRQRRNLLAVVKHLISRLGS